MDRIELRPSNISDIQIVYSSDEFIYYLENCELDNWLFSIDTYDTRDKACKAALNWKNIKWRE